MKKTFTLSIIALTTVFGMSCSKQTSQTQPQTQPQTPSFPMGITLYAWAESFDEETFALFEERTGITVNYVSHDDPTEMEAQLKSRPGAFDVVVVDDANLGAFRETKLLAELDHSQIPNLKNINAEYRGLDYDKTNQFCVPYVWGTTLVAYRMDKIPDPVKSWKLLFDERYSGKTMFIGERLEAITTGLLTLGLHPNSMDSADIDQAVSLLSDGINQRSLRFGGGVEIKDALVNSDIWAGVVYSGDAAVAAMEDENIGYFIPKEGAPIWVDNFAISRTSTKKEAAHLFINFLLEGKVAAANSNATFFATPNDAAIPHLSKELINDPSVYPEEAVMNRCFVFEKREREREELLKKGWLKLQQQIADSSIPATATVAGETDTEE